MAFFQGNQSHGIFEQEIFCDHDFSEAGFYDHNFRGYGSLEASFHAVLAYMVYLLHGTEISQLHMQIFDSHAYMRRNFMTHQRSMLQLIDLLT